MRILGIDPGSRITGFGVINVLRSGKMGYVGSGCIRVPGGTLSERIKVIYDGVMEIIDRYEPQALAIEKVFMARNADSALKLGQARASPILAAMNRALAVSEYSALQIKRAVVGRGHADKEQVKHMVKALLELTGTPQTDASDALACAICHANHAFGGGIAVRRAQPRLRALRQLGGAR
ncbi:MAG: crossover junction endodeoxyribonuclease RuvC [Acidiferrobacterales bacterium]